MNVVPISSPVGRPVLPGMDGARRALVLPTRRLPLTPGAVLLPRSPLVYAACHYPAGLRTLLAALQEDVQPAEYATLAAQPHSQPQSVP